MVYQPIYKSSQNPWTPQIQPKSSLLQSRAFELPVEDSEFIDPGMDALDMETESKPGKELEFNILANIPISAPTPPPVEPNQPPLQMKGLTIGEPGDKYEQEADRVARKVVSEINSSSPELQQPPALSRKSMIQRKKPEKASEELTQEIHSVKGEDQLEVPDGEFTVTDPQAIIRRPPPDLGPESGKPLIAKGKKVELLEGFRKETKDYVKVQDKMPSGFQGLLQNYGWTAASNIEGLSPILLKMNPKTQVSDQVTSTGSEADNADVAKTIENLEPITFDRRQSLNNLNKQLKKLQEKSQHLNSKERTKKIDKQIKKIENKIKQIENKISEVDAILELAGEDPGMWFKNFTKITFLGLKMNNPIHIELAKHLIKVEKKFLKEYGSIEEAKKQLGVSEIIKGCREYSTSAEYSMHLFGLAIDLDYWKNPYVALGTKSRNNLNRVLKRAGKLLNKELKFKKDWKSDLSKVYEQNSDLDKSLEQYFSFSYDKPSKKTELSKYLQHTKDPEWLGKTVEEAQNIIQQDIDSCAESWSRKGQKDQITESGMMNLKKELVLGIDLDWGGRYGDYMHFDMRNKPIGQKIYQAIQRYKKTQKKKNKQ